VYPPFILIEEIYLIKNTYNPSIDLILNQKGWDQEEMAQEDNFS
jgi:hypothetical protein